MIHHAIVQHERTEKDTSIIHRDVTVQEKHATPHHATPPTRILQPITAAIPRSRRFFDERPVCQRLAAHGSNRTALPRPRTAVQLYYYTTGTAGPVRLYSCTTPTARGYIVQIDNTAALSHQSQYIGRPTGTAGPVRLYSCTTTTARGYILQIDALPVQLDPYGCTHMHSCTTTTARGYIVQISDCGTGTAVLSRSKIVNSTGAFSSKKLL
jgi:hypothetical protein